MTQATSAYRNGDYTQSRGLLSSAIEEAQQAGDPSTLPGTLSRAGEMLAAESRAADAEQYLRRAIKIYDEMLAKKTADAQVIQRNRVRDLGVLALVLKAQNRLMESAQADREFLAVAPELVNLQARTKILHNYVDDLRQLGQADQADKAQVDEALKDPELNQSNTFKSGVELLHLGKVDEAYVDFSVLETLARRRHQADWQQQSAHWLALCQLYRQQYQSAQTYAQESIDLAKDAKLGKKQKLAQSMTVLAIALEGEGKANEAKSLAAQAVALDKATVADIYGALASSCYSTQKYWQAETFATKALALSDGDSGRSRYKLMKQLAAAQSMEKKYARAVKTLESALPLAPPGRPRADTLHMLAFCYFMEQNFPQAIKYDRQSIALREKLQLDPDLELHCDIGNLAFCLMTQNQYKEAEPLWQRALAEARLVAPQVGQRMADNVLADFEHRLGQTYAAEGKYAQASDAYEHITPTFARAGGEDYRQVLKEFADVLRKLHRNAQAEALDRTRAQVH